MSEKKKMPDIIPKIFDDPSEIIDGPLKIIDELNSAIERIDGTIKKLDEGFKTVDEKLTGNPPIPPATAYEKRGHTGSYSYKGQTPEDYCLECLQRHYSKALGLLEEAERFSLKHGKLTPEAKERVRMAIKEIVTAEEDLGTEIRDPELGRMLDEINVVQRDLRKWMWAERLTTTQEDISKLREAIRKAKGLVDLTYKASERYHSKFGYPLVLYGDRLIDKLCSRLGGECREIFDKLRRGEISADEAYRRIRAEGERKGLTDEDINRIIEESRLD
ncbi:hypothetical protein J7L97_05885 [Candidatus Bathyarchaeota archaeon]|nr:hypothetical protein [Candidatus Bathyarchaeota archaeon]